MRGTMEAIERPLGHSVLFHLSKRRFTRLAVKYSLALILVLFVAVLGLLNNSFLSGSNFGVILQQVATNAMLATGATFVILSGGIDLSVGSIVGLSGVVAAMFAQNDGTFPAVEAAVMGVLAGSAVGAFNGALVAVARVPSFVVTLGSMTIALGTANVLSDGRPVSGLSDDFIAIGGGHLLGLPCPVAVMLIVVACAYVVLTRTRLGWHVYAVGGNEQAARLAGVKTPGVHFLMFLISGTLAGIAGVILAARVTAGIPTTGAGYELNAIAAAVIGGISLKGGRGSLLGTVFGFMIMGVLDNGLNIIDVSAFYQLIIKGLIIVCAVFVDSLASKHDR